MEESKLLEEPKLPGSSELTFKEMKELKDAMLSLKQGEAIERASTPRNYDEAVSLGNFGHQTVYAMAVLEAHQKFIESLTGYKGNILLKFNEMIGRASGSIGTKRMEKTLETVGQLGQYMPMMKHDMPKPTSLSAPHDH
jgi:hypothetical protein